MNQTTIPALVIRRTYDAAPQRVYEAWTDPAIAGQFLCAGDIVSSEVQMDVRPGGRYSIVMVRPDGDRWTVTGTYQEVRAPHFLSMTWRWVEDDPADEKETLLTLEFNPSGSGTELVLTHDRFALEESRDNHLQGWTMIADKLQQVLSRP